MSKTRLEFDYEYDFLLFGISCHLKDYRLCWALNKHLQLQLKKEKDLVLDPEQGEDGGHFSYYSWQDETRHLQYITVANRGDKSWLVHEQRQADYFLIIEGYIDMVEPAEVLNNLRKIPVILTAYSLDPNELKSKQNLIFD